MVGRAAVTVTRESLLSPAEEASRCLPDEPTPRRQCVAGWVCGACAPGLERAPVAALSGGQWLSGHALPVAVCGCECDGGDTDGAWLWSWKGHRPDLAPRLVEGGPGLVCRACRARACGLKLCCFLRGRSNPRVVGSRHQRLYSLLDRLRLATAPGSRGPCPPATSHPLDGEGPLALETVSPDKVSAQHVCVTRGPVGALSVQHWFGLEGIMALGTAPGLPAAPGLLCSCQPRTWSHHSPAAEVRPGQQGWVRKEALTRILLVGRQGCQWESRCWVVTAARLHRPSAQAHLAGLPLLRLLAPAYGATTPRALPHPHRSTPHISRPTWGPWCSASLGSSV